MNTDLVDSMNIDQSLIFAHDENEIILEVDEEDAQQTSSNTKRTTNWERLLTKVRRQTSTTNDSKTLITWLQL